MNFCATNVSRRTFMAASLASGLLLPMSRSLAQSDPAPKKGGRLRVGLGAGSARDNLDAKGATTEADMARQNNIYDTLLTWSPEYKLEPSLAETVEPSESAKVWTIKLRKGVVFHHGKALTSKDVAHTLRYIVDPKNPGAAAARLGQLDESSIEAVDDLTLRVRFKTPFSIFPEVLAEAGSAGVRIIPEDYDPAKPVGTGAFKLQSFDPGVRSLFVKNENYWREGQPFIDELEMINLIDDAARVNALLSGQVDAIASLPANQLRIFEPNSQFKVINSDTGAWNALSMNTQLPPFNDVRVRQAMRLLINRPQMVKQVLSGQGVVANDLFGRFDPGYAKNIPQREVDVDQAKSLLKKAGQEGLTMELVTSPLSIGMVTMCEAFVQQASLGGVTLKLRQVDPSTYWSQIWMKAPVGMDYWAARNYLTQAADCMLPSSPYNDTFWKNDRWLKIVNEAFAEQDDAKRAELISAAQHIEHDEGGYMIWGFYNRIDGVHSKVQGLSADRSGISFNSYSFRRAWLAA